MKLRIVVMVMLLWCALVPMPAQGQSQKCFVLCQPNLKIEPNSTWENLFHPPRIAETDDQGNTVVKRATRERVFETVIALGIPTTVPRVGFTFEAIVKPFVIPLEISLERLTYFFRAIAADIVPRSIASSGIRHRDHASAESARCQLASVVDLSQSWRTLRNRLSLPCAWFTWPVPPLYLRRCGGWAERRGSERN